AATRVQAEHAAPRRIGRHLLRPGTAGQGVCGGCEQERERKSGGHAGRPADAPRFRNIHSDHADTPVQRGTKEHSTNPARKIRVRGWSAWQKSAKPVLLLHHATAFFPLASTRPGARSAKGDPMKQRL